MPVGRPPGGGAGGIIITVAISLPPGLAAVEHGAARRQGVALALEAGVVLAAAMAGIGGEGPVAGTVGGREAQVVAVEIAAGRGRRATRSE